MAEGIKYEPVDEKRGRWTITGTREIYSNQYGMTLVEDRVIRPDGKPGIRTRLAGKAGVYVVPVDEHGNVYLINEFYYNWNETSLACVTGGVDAGRTPREQAEKELKEERGLIASRWDLLGKFQPTGLQNVPTWSYLARDLKTVKPELESVETIESVKMPLETAVGKIGTEIKDACSGLSLCLAYLHLSNTRLIGLSRKV
jgi:hypothetical protein